jgi:hypothetical protein
MSVETSTDNGKKSGFSPFVLKWAEKTPEGLLWSHRSVFSPAVNGLDVYLVTGTDNRETTGTSNESADTTSPN